MKTKLIIIGLAVAIRVQADTNFFNFLTCGNVTYTNATINHVTPSYATVSFAGGIVQVPLRDLPENLQQQYHYNSNTAAKYVLEQNEKSKQLRAATAARQAAYEKAMAAQIAQSKKIQVSSIIDETSNGGIPLCAVGYSGGGGGGGGGEIEHPIPGRILLSNMPSEVVDFFRGYQKLKSDIATFESQPVTVTANSTVYNPDGTIDQFGSQLASQSAASDAYYQAKEAKREKLEQMKSQLDELKDSQWDHTTVQAYPTGQTFGGYEVWTCIGMAR
jgi:hypothetical protein